MKGVPIPATPRLCSGRIPLAIATCLWAVCALAGPLPPLNPPVAFFTNIANRLLEDSVGLSTRQIQVWPTNQYTPGVHRFLQLAANLYDATTNNAWPSVFRPIFRTEGTNVFIVDYQELPDAQLLDPGVMTLLDPAVPTDFASIPPRGAAGLGVLAEPMLVGVPLVIGARKGLPNFNEFAMQTVVQVQRKLQLRKSPFNPWLVLMTNQMYFITISNAFGVEAWNSYSTTYSNGLRLSTLVDLTTTLSNQTAELNRQTTITGAGYSNIAATYNWPKPTLLDPTFRTYRSIGSFVIGTNSDAPQNGFWVTLRGNQLFLPNSQYWGTNAPSLRPENTAWPTAPTGFAVPHLTLLLSARVRFALVDTDNNRILDFVNLANLTQTIDLPTQSSTNTSFPSALWLTNRLNFSYSENVPTLGIINQLRASTGEAALSFADWNSCSLPAVGAQAKDMSIDAFRYFMGLSPLHYPTNVTNVVMETPFNPVQKTATETRWQVNDPLVHYTTGDLEKNKLTSMVIPPSSTNFLTLANLGYMNSRTRPWTGNPDNATPASDAYDPTLKDPLVLTSDCWDFPTNAPLTLATLSRVHRGTPWQTISFKAVSATPQTWLAWRGNSSWGDAALSLPQNDWHLAELWQSWFNTQPASALTSVNDPNTNAWLAALDGIAVLTNTVSDSDFRNPRALSQFTALTITADSVPAAALTDAIATARAAQPGGYFHGLAEMLALPALSLTSPWLNVSTTQQQFGLSDAAYEAIPMQLLPRLRPDSIGAATMGNAGLQLQFTGWDDFAYVLESSPDLSHWLPVATNRPQDGVLQWPNGFETNSSARYFRTVLAQ